VDTPRSSRFPQLTVIFLKPFDPILFSAMSTLGNITGLLITAYAHATTTAIMSLRHLDDGHYRAARSHHHIDPPSPTSSVHEHHSYHRPLAIVKRSTSSPQLSPPRACLHLSLAFPPLPLPTVCPFEPARHPSSPPLAFIRDARRSSKRSPREGSTMNHSMADWLKMLDSVHWSLASALRCSF
jgi:hypothetical protein